MSNAPQPGPTAGAGEPVEFDKRMALELIEDALTDLASANGRGMATGLCGALYLVGLLSKTEWEGFLMRIPPEHPGLGTD